MVEANPAQPAAVRRSLAALLITIAVMVALLFAPAGTLDWPLGWLFLFVFILAVLLATATLWCLNPDIFVARSRVQPGTKTLDYFIITLVMAGFVCIAPVAGLDFRFGWSRIPQWLVWVGYMLFVLSFAGQAWPQAVNRHFEPGVRVQKDRGQIVIDTGPYAIVRHPGYISASLLAASMAFCLGSWWALLPSAVVVIGLIPRTLFEERTLIAELPGYREYTQRVRYRWVPGIW